MKVISLLLVVGLSQLNAAYAQQQEAVAQNRSATLSITTAQQKVVLAEPIILSVSLRSSESLAIPLGLRDNLRFVVTLPKGQQIDGGSVPPFDGIVNANMPFEMIDKQSLLFTEVNLPSEVLQISEVGTYKVRAVLDTSWYHLKLPANVFSSIVTSNEISFEVIRPQDVDAKALELIQKLADEKYFSVALDDLSKQKLREQIIEDYPNSTYAKYARFYSGEYFRTFLSEQLRGSKTYTEYLNRAIENYQRALTDHPPFALSGQAQLGIARSYVLLNNYEVAKREAHKAVQNYPRSFAAQEANKILSKIASTPK